jgi:3-oxoacyl-[acyl-carrier protein] reductase
LSIKDKVVLITGAASGIGRAAAIHFGQNGAQLMIADVAQEGLTNTLESCKTNLNGVKSKVCDIGNSSDVRSLVDQTRQHYGRIDVLIHAAGICRAAPMLEMSDEDWQETLRVNLNGSFYITRETGKIMAAQKSGTMILMTSDRGVYGSADYAQYAASKGGMIALVKSLALHMGQFNVTVNGLNPGMTDTPLSRGANPTKYDSKLVADVLGKATTPMQVAHTLMYLATEASVYTTGQIIGTRLRHGQ